MLDIGPGDAAFYEIYIPVKYSCTDDLGLCRKTDLLNAFNALPETG